MQKDAESTFKDNPWLKGIRFVGTNQNRSFCYCSDECELNNIATGAHNPVEPKRIIPVPGSGSLVEQAAAQAGAQETATKALKEGKEITLASN
jgi:hypothetical protein